MKIAVTFFRGKTNKNSIYNVKNRFSKSSIIQKGNNKNKGTILKQKTNLNSNNFNFRDILYVEKNVDYSIKLQEILICFAICIILVYNQIPLMSLSSNIFKIGKIDISKEDIFALKGVANINNYIFSNEKLKEEIVDEKATVEEIAMDNLATSYYEQPVFNNMKNIDVQVLAENNTFQKINVCGIDIINYSTKRDIDYKRIINEIEDITLSKTKDDILLYTTHTSESYANSSKYQFEYTSPRRTTNGKYNMLAIATKLASNLNNKGINTICSTTPHDYGEYNSAYSNSRYTFENVLKEQNNVHMAIDVHRDAIEDLEFAPISSIKGYDVASLMLVIGIGYDDGFNPYYEQNLKLAFELELLANKIYPGLFRPMIIRNSIYNQDIMPNSFLVEVGASGNTIEQAELATRCLANLINILYRD